MAVTNIGHVNDTTSGSTVVLSGVTVPAGACIVVGVRENQNTSTSMAGRLTDSVGNTYQLAAQVSGGISGATTGVAMYYCLNATALSSGSITYTRANPGVADYTNLSAGYETGLAATAVLDAAVVGTATTGGTNANHLTITSGTPSATGETLFAYAANNLATAGGMTNDAAWSNPPFDTTPSSTGVNATGGYRTVALSPVTYATTISGGSNAGIGGIIIGFGVPPSKAGGLNMPMMGF